MRITGIRIARLEHPLDPPLLAAWDPIGRRSVSVTLVRVETDEGVTGIGSGDTTDGFEAYAHLLLWLEEPLDGADLRGLAALRATSRIRIAGGEMTRSFPEVLAELDADACDVYQPDVVLAVGLLRARAIAELALARNRWFTPHTWANGICLLANLQVAAGVGGGPYLEFPYDPPGWTPERRDFMLATPIGIDEHGRLPVPLAPGLGIELSPGAQAAVDGARRWTERA